MNDISKEVKRLVQYGLKKGLIHRYDSIYTQNRIMEVLDIQELKDVEIGEDTLGLEEILENITAWAVQNRRIKADTQQNRDLFDTSLMGCLTPRPSEVIGCFNELYKRDKRAATDYFYKLSRDTNYIRVQRVNRDLKWKTHTEFGELDITVNMSKPEKDPRDIAAEKNIVKGEYPKCLLCRENEGYAGRLNHPGRQNHRVIPINLTGEEWFMQYSPYVYYNEHCIVLKGEHEEMKLTGDTFTRLLEFVEHFPHYFIGSNADLPIVGGSILSHDHFQGGRYDFPMAKAETLEEYRVQGLEGVVLKRLKWPMSVIRVEGSDREKVSKASDYIYRSWQAYSDEKASIINSTNGVMHNTVTPIGRMKNNLYQMDIVLRNNRTSREYPEGIFHPHRDLHHIKRENIGLIEVMGLAVLPGRLSRELKELSYFLVHRDEIHRIEEHEELIKHRDWCLEILEKHQDINEGNVQGILENEVGLKFLRVLMDAGVYKANPEGKETFNRFIKAL